MQIGDFALADYRGSSRAPGYCGGNTEARKRADVIPHSDPPRSPPNKRHATIPISHPFSLSPPVPPPCRPPTFPFPRHRSRATPARPCHFVWQDSNDRRSIIRGSGGTRGRPPSSSPTYPRRKGGRGGRGGGSLLWITACFPTPAFGRSSACFFFGSLRPELLAVFCYPR